MLKENKKFLWILIFALLIGPILGIYAGVISPMLDKIFGETASRAMGFSFGIVVILFSLYIAASHIRAFLRGERSWKVWLPALIIILFWLFLLAGEFLFPH